MKIRRISGCVVSVALLIGCSQQNPANMTPSAAKVPPHQPESVTDSRPPETIAVPPADKEVEAPPATIAAEPTPSETTNVTSLPKGEPLDLTAYYQTPASNFARIEQYPWREAPTGTQVFGNVPLEIGGMICLWGGANAERGLVFPEYVEAIQVERKFEAFYLYHATFHTAPEGTPVVHLIFNFENGESDSYEICCGTHVADWMGRVGGLPELTDPKSKLVWHGKDSRDNSNNPREVRFFITEIANPRPSEKVTSIDLVSAKEKPASCILAMTTGPAGLLKMEPEKESKTE